MSDTEHLDQDAFVCPEYGGWLPAFLLPETDDYDTPMDGGVVAWTKDGERARIVVGLDWNTREREVSKEWIEASREAGQHLLLRTGSSLLQRARSRRGRLTGLA